MSDTTTQDDKAPSDDIRSLLQNAFDEHAPEGDAGERPERTARERPEPERDTAREAPERTQERARGPDGKFIRTEAEEAAERAEKPAAEPARKDTTAAKPDTAAAPTETPAPGAKDPPANWLEADKQTFKALEPRAQDFLLRRHAAMEADYTRKTQAVADLRRDYEPVAQMFAPYAQHLAQRNLTPAALIQGWANVEQKLVSGQGVDVIRGLVDSYRIPRDQLAAALGIRAPANAAGGDQPIPEPQPAQQQQLPPEIVQRLTAHEQWIMQEQQRQQYMAQQAQHETASRVMTDIERFAAETDSSGQPTHPHFRDVENEMARLVLAYRAAGQREPSLSELYEQAVWANPSTRTHLLDRERAAHEAQRTAAEEQRKVAARVKAEQSRRAGASITGSPGGPSQAPGRGRSNGSVRDDIAAAFEDMDAV